MHQRLYISVGDRFGKLVVIGTHIKRPRTGTRYHRIFYPCICDCGSYSIVDKYKLISGHTKSCGCLSIVDEVDRKRNHVHYQRAADILDRCTNSNAKVYHRYGGRGIKCFLGDKVYAVCLSLDRVPGYKPGLQIDRIDNDGHYTLWSVIHGDNIFHDNNGTPCRGNLRWVTPHSNTLNRCNSITEEILATTPRRRRNALYTMRSNGWSFDDFDEIYAGKNKNGRSLYIYKRKTI